MNWFTRAITSSIGRKLIMSLTGLFLVSFLLVHLIGNMQLFYKDQGDAFNKYTEFMSHNAVIRILELGLVLGFVLHIYNSVVLTQRNKAARPQAYAYRQPSPGTTWYSRNMGVTGSIILVFLIMHLYNFYWRYKFGEVPYVMIGEGAEAKPYKDMYRVVAQGFQQWFISVPYVLAMVLLAFHLMHGFQSAFRTLGLDHKKYTPAVQAVGTFLAVLVPVLFAAMPVYFLLNAPEFKDIVNDADLSALITK